jgi:CHAT domain-containing protein/Tfp pilus assembly protein PilF
MDCTELATLLAKTNDTERAGLLSRYESLVDVELGWRLKELYDEHKTSDPAVASSVSDALTTLAERLKNLELISLAAWVAGMTKLQIEGQIEDSLVSLDSAIDGFEALGQSQRAAATQVSKVYALAVLGRHDEAAECGLQARDVLLHYDDLSAAGKIEHNLGSMYARRDSYEEAEQFLKTALARFSQLRDEKQLALVETTLAYVFTSRHQFRAAAQMYEQALARTEAAGLTVTQAAIECNLGWLALFQSRYDRALDYLEKSRRRYIALNMAHESAIADLELADAYLELNLASEASDIYARVKPEFTELGMKFESAWALTHHARASLLLNQIDQARELLVEARELFVSQGNNLWEATVSLIEAQTYYAERQYAKVIDIVSRIENVFTATSNWGWLLLGRWLRGDSYRRLGRHNEAEKLLEETLNEAKRQALPQVAQRCYVSLGLLAAEIDNCDQAEHSFKQAVKLVEELRAPLPGEEFRTAFISDKLTPHAELVRLCLTQGRLTEALDYVERARSRALVEMLGGALQVYRKPRDEFEAELLGRLEELREKLNFLYNQINRPEDGESARGPAEIARLYETVRERETEIAEINRQLNQRGDDDTVGAIHASPLRLSDDIARIQHDLGDDTALVEYFSLDGELMAFVVTNEGVNVARDLAREEDVEAAVTELRFQTDSLRYGAERMQKHLSQLTRRTLHYLSSLYEMLLAPIDSLISERRLVIAPYRALHYVPFHALYDGSIHVIERREVCYAPSAAVLRHCLAQPKRALRRALLLGVPDMQIPRVRDEILELTSLFPESNALLDEQATRVALREHAPTADVLHLACHGWFRPDNPLFSSLKLGDGWLTVRDAYGLDLNCGLVALSACETGVSAVAPGDELLGIARGFLSSGVPSLLVSLWTVDDASTAEMMRSFYTRLHSGDRPAAALREAQLELLDQGLHPFFWSPFVLIGRW